MSAAAKLGAFALGLIVVFAAAYGVGRVAGPSPAKADGQHGKAHTPAQTQQAAMPGGLQIAQDGYRLDVLTPQLSTSDAAEFRFRVVGADSLPVKSYTTAHDKELHLVVVRRDLTGFQHVHPAPSPDGVWSVPLAVNAAGSYRVFADFQPAGRTTGLVLGADVSAPGDYQPQDAAHAATKATVGDYTVSLEGDLVAGTTAKLTLTVSRGGVPVADLEPYLGALGHLVALRAGDLAYLHVHTEESATAGPQIVFYAEVPSDGRYGLFLDFQHAGTVHTAQFTAVAGHH